MPRFQEHKQVEFSDDDWGRFSEDQKARKFQGMGKNQSLNLKDPFLSDINTL